MRTYRAGFPAKPDGARSPRWSGPNRAEQCNPGVRDWRRTPRCLHAGVAGKTAKRDGSAMLLWREKIPETWLRKVRDGLPAVLVDHAHLERKAATSALTLEKYVE